MSKRSNVKFVQDEPSFIRQFKERIGYKEGPNIDTKKQKLDYDDGDDDHSETEEEKPVVVVLKAGDLNSQEAAVIQKKIEEESAIRDGKIQFKKPVKKGEETSTDVKTADKNKEEKLSKDKSSKSKLKQTNSSLLSFGDEEEDE